MPDKEAFNKILRANITRASKLEWLSKKTGQPVEAIQHLLDVKGRKGMKILGKRFGSNINTLAGYFHELAKEHSRKKPPRSKRKIESVKDAKNYIRKGPITPQSRMMIAEDKYLAKDMDLRKSILDTTKSVKEDRRR